MANGSDKGGKMVVVVGLLLFLVSFFGPISAEFNKAAEYHYLPDYVRVMASVFAGIVSGLATVIAYLNTGYTRYKDAKKAESGSGMVATTTVAGSASQNVIAVPTDVPSTTASQTTQPVEQTVTEPPKGT